MADSKEIPKVMKALRLTKYNQNYELKHDVPVPTPGKGELLVRVEASGFCHTDYQVYQGVYKTKCPHTPSHEPAGTIAALGPDVSGDWAVGQRVGVLNFRNPCGTCGGCKWRKAACGTLDARYCSNKTMAGILNADGGFAEYMITADYAAVHLPDGLSAEQAAPLMCAGATVWNALIQANLTGDQTVAIVGIGGLGVLGLQFAKALGYRTVAVDNRDVGLKLAGDLGLKPDLIVSSEDPDVISKIDDFTGGIGLNAVVVCTDSPKAADWSLQRLQPRGTAVLLGLPEEGFKFDAFNLVFRELNVRGSLHCSRDEVEKMLKVVEKHNITSHLTKVPIDEAEKLPEKVAAHDFVGRLVVTI